MKAASVTKILRAFQEYKVRFLIAGGLAVNAHGYLRFTKDVDFAIQLIPENIGRAFDALESIGYRPNIPVTKEQFADDPTRRGWIEENAMRVLQFWSETHRETPVDVFVEIPFDFELELASAPRKEVSGIGSIPIVTLPTLLQMKKSAGRSQDLIDIEQLKLRHEQGK